jgi:hypothetical protein
MLPKHNPIYLDANARWLPYTLTSTLGMILSSPCAKQSIETNSPLKIINLEAKWNGCHD